MVWQENTSVSLHAEKSLYIYFIQFIQIYNLLEWSFPVSDARFVTKN